MAEAIRIQMMGHFLIYIDETRVENPVSKSRKGAALMLLLALNGGRSVPNQRLLRALWEEHRVTNPENALKTLVSRARAMLNAMSPGLGQCIASDRGAYRWQTLPGMRVDLLELNELFNTVALERDPAALRGMYKRILELYTGDMYQTGEFESETAYAQQLHTQYLKNVYDYIDLLHQTEEYNEISAVCRTALDVDAFDDRLHIELMKAMVNLDRVSDAMAQYQHATNLTYRFLGTPPSEEMKAYYRQMSRSQRTLKFNLDAIRNQLQESSRERGAFICDYGMFREIYNLQMRNLERLGSTMFLGIIMLGDPTAPMEEHSLSAAVGHLLELCREHLRKGDIITRFSPNIVAVLLPTVNYETGNMVMERIRQLFYKEYPGSGMPFQYRLGVLGSQEAIEAENALAEDEA